MTPRRAALASLAALVLASACAHTHYESSGVRYAIDRSACCGVPEGTDAAAEAAACEARGCTWQQELLCMGVDFPDEESREEHRRSVEQCERACACICAEDVEACASVP